MKHISFQAFIAPLMDSRHIFCLVQESLSSSSSRACHGPTMVHKRAKMETADDDENYMLPFI
jgi:hypothetical protein